MRSGIFLLATLPFLFVTSVQAQSTGRVNENWRRPGSPRTASAERSTAPLVPLRTAQRETIAKVSQGAGTLPNRQGQIWREYDITPYTARNTENSKPQQVLVDWILRDTGYEAWHGDPVALLSASRRTLRVYHTPEMQQVVADVVDRFVSRQHQEHEFSLRVITIGHPNWRTTAGRMLQPVPVQSQGVEAWLVAKEDASLLVAELARRHDYLSHNAAQSRIKNGRRAELISTRPRSYIKSFSGGADNLPSNQPQLGTIDEGFRLELSPLVSLDGRTADAVVKLSVDQVERMIQVSTGSSGFAVEIPQMAGVRMQERFRWPVGKVLLVSLGMVPSPAPPAANPLGLPFTKPTGRSDMLLMIQSQGSPSKVARGR